MGIIGGSCHKYSFCHAFVATKHVFCLDKSFIMTNMIFLASKCLSRHAYFCHDNYVLLQQTPVCCDKHVFVVTKIILVAVFANDRRDIFWFSYLVIAKCSFSVCDALPMVLNRGVRIDLEPAELYHWLQLAIEFYISYITQPSSGEGTSAGAGRLAMTSTSSLCDRQSGV